MHFGRVLRSSSLLTKKKYYAMQCVHFAWTVAWAVLVYELATRWALELPIAATVVIGLCLVLTTPSPSDWLRSYRNYERQWRSEQEENRTS